MARKPTFRQLLLSFLAVYEDVSHKELAVRAGLSPKTLSHHLRRTDVKEEKLERLMEALGPRPAAVRIVTACVEALEDLDRQKDLSEQDLEFIEAEVLAAARRTREHLTDILRRSRNLPDEGYPEAADLPAYRYRAARQWQRMEDLSEEMALVAVRTAPELQTWALSEKVCEESEKAASRSIERATALAWLAVEIAERVRGPEGWCKRVRGYAGAHGPNVLRVSGELKAADVKLMEAKELWLAGEDPAGVLDPGRLLDLEASLRRAQRRFEEALKLLDEAAAVGRSPERLLIKKGFTLEVMGEYQRAIQVLLEAEPLAAASGDKRSLYMVRFNLAVNYSHVGRYSEAIRLVEEVIAVAVESGDRNELSRVLWLEGRIAAGLGHRDKARRLLGEARRRFAAAGMDYDVALALLEEATMALADGRVAEAKTLARELPGVFESRGVHREALIALSLFSEEAERETATVELASSVLRFLFRARHDQGFRFIFL